MAIQQLFYRTAVPVHSQRHRDLSVRTGSDYSFARGANSAPINASEFSEVAAEYPIVFAGETDNFFPAAILGTRDAENLFVDDTGKWKATYIPAFVRRYPFVFSLDESGQRFTLLIDEEFEGANKENRGERLFDADGEQTQYLGNVLRFLQEYQSRFARTQAFGRRLAEHDLLTPMQAEFATGDGSKSRLSGFRVVDREKLKSLAPDVLAEMCSNDELECIYLHLASLRHFRTMLERLQGRAAPPEVPDPGAGSETDVALPSDDAGQPEALSADASPETEVPQQV